MNQELLRKMICSSVAPHEVTDVTLEGLQAKLTDMEMKHTRSSQEAARMKLFALTLEDKLVEMSMENE
jgi:hypothetical protein